ncbi:sugar ABC transporter substrate-binding protein [Streptomyces sp. ODS28]|uniref:ABC transporter substrate-binding protein n=1 Tax=Streptomyces sp. ODS28 TaxID=3136688 RepID=UPI0031EDC278
MVGRRKLLSTLGGAALGAGALAGCGSNTGRGGTDSGGGPTLEHWYHQYGEPGVEQAVQRYADDYPKAHVRIQWRPGNYDQQTAAALLTSSGPDVFEVNGPTIEMIQGGRVADLTALLEGNGVRADFDPAALEPKIWEGRVWGIPQAIDTQVLYYRKSMLRRAGVRPPRTLDELLDAAQELTTKDVKGLFLGNDGGAGVLSQTPLNAAGLEFVTKDGEVGFDDPAAARALGKLRRPYEDGSLLLGAPSDWADPAAFTQGLTAMQWSGLWALPMVRKALGGDFGVLPFPADGKQGRPAVPVGAYAAAVAQSSPHREAAKAYMRWLWVEHAEHQRDFALSYGFHLPARRSLARHAKPLQEGEAARAAEYARAYGKAEPLLWTNASRTAYQDALSRIIKDGADPDREVRAVVRKVRTELARVRNRAGRGK